MTSCNSSNNPFLTHPSLPNPSLVKLSEMDQEPSKLAHPQVESRKAKVSFDEDLGRGVLMEANEEPADVENYKLQLVKDGTMNGKTHMDIDLPPLKPQRDLPPLIDQDAFHVYQSPTANDVTPLPDFDEVSWVQTPFTPFDQTSTSSDLPKGRSINEDSHSDLSDTLGIVKDDSQAIPVEESSFNITPPNSFAINEDPEDIPNDEVSSQTHIPHFHTILNQHENVQPDPTKEASPDVRDEHHDSPDSVEEAKGPTIRSSVAQGKMPDVSKSTASEEKYNLLVAGKEPTVFLDERQRFYSGKVKDSSRNKPMRYVPLEAMTKKNSVFIKSRYAATIHAKIPDIPILPEIARTTTQIFFAFLYLLTQRTWRESSPDCMTNKMGFWTSVLPRLEYPSSLRHLTTKRAFLKRLDRIMVSVAHQIWEPEDKEKEWVEPGRYDDYDPRHLDFNDVTIPFFLWHKWEDHELLALTEVLLAKTERDQKIDDLRISRNLPLSRLAIRTKQLFRLVQDPPDELFDKIRDLQHQIDRVANQLEAETSSTPDPVTNEEDFIDRYTYYLPKTPEEIAKLAAAQKEKLDFDKIDAFDTALGQRENEREVPALSKPKRVKIPSTGRLNCDKYPIPPSISMIRQAQKNGEEAKRPINYVKLHGLATLNKNISKAIKKKERREQKKKKKKKNKEVIYEKPVRASKQRANEKLLQSYAEYEKFAEEEGDPYMNGVEEHNDMGGYGDQQKQANTHPFAAQNDFYEPYAPQWQREPAEEVHEGDDTSFSQKSQEFEEGDDRNSTQTTVMQNGFMDQDQSPGHGHPGDKTSGFHQGFESSGHDHSSSSHQYYNHLDYSYAGSSHQAQQYLGHGHPDFGYQQYQQQAYDNQGYQQEAYQQQIYKQTFHNQQAHNHQEAHNPQSHNKLASNNSHTISSEPGNQSDPSLSKPNYEAQPKSPSPEREEDINSPTQSHSYPRQNPISPQVQNLSPHLPTPTTQPTPITHPNTPQLAPSSPNLPAQETLPRPKKLTIKFVKKPAQAFPPPTALPTTNATTPTPKPNSTHASKKRKRTSPDGADADFDLQNFVEPDDEGDDDYSPGGQLDGGGRSGAGQKRKGRAEKMKGSGRTKKRTRR